MTAAVTWQDAPFEACGPVERFGPHADRVAVLLDHQRSLWSHHPGSWVTVPLDRIPPVFAIVAADAEGERRAREVVAAFIGPDTGVLAADRLALDRTATADRLLGGAGIDHVVIVHRNPNNPAEDLLAALELLVTVRNGQPDLRREPDLPLAFLLRDFWLALQHRDAPGSQRLFDLIEASSLVSADNLRFLTVDRLAALGRWQELADLVWFRDLSQARRPRRITEHLLESLWRSHMESADAFAGPADALRRFVEAGLGEQYTALLRSVDVPATTRARRLVAVAAVTDENRERYARIQAAATPDESSFLAELAAIGWTDLVPGAATVESPAPAGAQARTRFIAGDWEGAVAVAEAHPHDAVAVEVAVRSAFETGDPTMAHRVAALLDLTDPDDLPTSPGFRGMTSQVRAVAANHCAGWRAWLHRVARSEPWPQAAEVARNAAASWPAHELAAVAVAASAQNDLLEAAGGVNAAQIQASLDLLCALATSLADVHAADDIVYGVLLVVGEQPSPSRQVRHALLDLLAAILDNGPSASRYGDCVAVCTTVWGRVKSTHAFDWALDTADLLVAAPCPDTDARLQFITTLIIWAQGRATPSRSPPTDHRRGYRRGLRLPRDTGFRTGRRRRTRHRGNLGHAQAQASCLVLPVAASRRETTRTTESPVPRSHGRAQHRHRGHRRTSKPRPRGGLSHRGHLARRAQCNPGHRRGPAAQ